MFTEKLFSLAQFGHEATLWLLVVLSVVSLGLIIERWLAFRQLKNHSDYFGDEIRKVLQRKRTWQMEDVENLIEDWTSMEGRALTYGLQHVQENGQEGLDEAFATYTIAERSALEKNLSFLATVGANAPFIGLLGTVFGVMEAFRGLATQADPNGVMIGISQALIATAIGLLVAIPAVVAYNHYRKQLKSMLLNIDSIKNLCISYGKKRKETLREV